MSDLLTRQQVERMGEHLCEENLSGVAGKILAHDAALRQQLAKAWEEAAQAVEDACNPFSSRFQKPEHVIAWCREQAQKEQG